MDDMDASAPVPDASAPDDVPAPGDASTDVGVDASGPDAAEPEPEPDPRFETAMTYTTANIGRNYGNRRDVQAVFDKIGDRIGSKRGPKYIGWQEIGEGDPCGSTCEIEALRNRFKGRWGWTTRRPRGVKVPGTSKGANVEAARAVFASSGWAGVSPTRFVVVIYYEDRNLSLVNTHFIAGAWSCKSNVRRRKRYWRQAWRTLKAEVAKEHDRGRNVVVTGDLNRPRGENRCNPAWDPTSMHRRAKIIGGAGIDYVFAVPSAGYRFAVARRADGSKKRGRIHLGIDGHKAHWVRGRFLHR